MALLGLREISEQPADPDILGLLRRLYVKALGFELHRRHFLADGVEREILGQPDRATAQKSFDVVPANRREIAAEARLVHLQQHVAVAFFLLRHFLEELRRFRIASGEIFGKTHVDAAVLLLAGNGDRQHFPFGQVGEISHRSALVY